MAAPTFGEYESAVRKTGESPKFVRLGSSFQIEAEAFRREMAGSKACFPLQPKQSNKQTNPSMKL